VSIVCIALGMTALITVLSVMNGFQREIRSRILSVASHVQVSAAGGKLADWQRVAAAARRDPQVVLPRRTSSARACSRTARRCRARSSAA
jgi:lipoprotein-releasing system permease protein